MYKKTILDNGLTLISYNMPSRESIGLGIWVKAGSRFENKNNQGIAHFLEHLLFKGSKKYSCQEIKQSIEGVGGSLNGFTGEEFCCYFVKIPYKYLNLALDILLDMVLNPLLKEEDIQKEKKVVMEEIKLYYDLPQNYVHQLLDELLWPDHPLGRNILGTYESIDRITRDALFLFKNSHYNLSDIVISACGNLNHKELIEKVRKIIPTSKIDKKPNFEKVPNYPEKLSIKISKRDIEQAHLALGFHGLSRNDFKRYVLVLLHIILGANMSSRLFNEVREKKALAYDIGTQVQFFLDSGSFVIHAGIAPPKTKLAIKVILKELERISQSPPSFLELKRAKEYYLGQLSISLEDTLEHMFWIGESTIALNKTYTLKNVEKQINRISAREIMYLARKIFLPQRRKLALVGPLEEKEEELLKYISKI
jgi:predicted Zn-dependent peptidase